MDDNNPRKYRRNTTHQQDIFPQTKVAMRRAPIPVSSKDPNVIRFKFLERPFRFYHGLSYHYQAFIKTAVLSWFMIIPVYYFVYYIANLKSKAEIMAKMDPDMNSDNLKKQIIDFKRREKLGLVERYEGS